jgi:hypothetical protein
MLCERLSPGREVALPQLPNTTRLILLTYCSIGKESTRLCEVQPMSAEEQGCYQNWTLRYAFHQNEPATIHTFGGRGSPILSFVAA